MAVEGCFQVVAASTSAPISATTSSSEMATLSTTTASPVEKRPPGTLQYCLHEDVVYAPTMPNPESGIEAREVPDGLAGCQSLCKNTAGCFHFSFWKQNSSCTL